MKTRHIGLGLLAIASLSLAPLGGQIHSRPFLEGYAATIVSNVPAATYNIMQNATMTISVNGGAPIAIAFDEHFGVAVPGDEVAAEITDDLYAAGVLLPVYFNSSNYIVIQSFYLGLQSSLKITDGLGSPAQAIGLTESLVMGAQTSATTATELNYLVRNEWDYEIGDKIIVSLKKPDGSQISATFDYGWIGGLHDGTTLGDLIDFLNSPAVFDSASPNGATVQLSTNGTVHVSSNGPAVSLALSISDEASTSQQGWTHWPSFIR